MYSLRCDGHHEIDDGIGLRGHWRTDSRKSGRRSHLSVNVSVLEITCVHAWVVHWNGTWNSKGVAAIKRLWSTAQQVMHNNTTAHARKSIEYIMPTSFRFYTVLSGRAKLLGAWPGMSQLAGDNQPWRKEKVDEYTAVQLHFRDVWCVIQGTIIEWLRFLLTLGFCSSL